MKKAFSLVELIVVVAIIAILSGVMMASFGGGTASASSRTAGVSAFLKIRRISRFDFVNRSSISGRKMTPSTRLARRLRAIRRAFDAVSPGVVFSMVASTTR